MSEQKGNGDEMTPTEFTEADEELARFGDDVRALYAKRAGEPIEQAQIDAIVEAATRTPAGDEGGTSVARRQQASSKRRLSLPRKRVVLLIAAAALGVALLAASLAAAGVSLPGIARAPLEHLGILPPNPESADPVDRVIDFSPPDHGNCSFGEPNAVSAYVGGQVPAVGLCSREDANGDGEVARGGSTGRWSSQSPLESARRSAPPQEHAFADKTSPVSQDLAQQIPPAANGQGVGQAQSQVTQMHQPSFAAPQIGQEPQSQAVPGGQPSEGRIAG